VAPRVFRGVQGDKYRKGEIFGTENLFRFKEDGSFLDDIWAESRSKGNNSSGLEIHDSGEVSKVLIGLTDKDKLRVREEEDAAVIQEMSGKKSLKFPDITKNLSLKGNILAEEESTTNSADESCAKDGPLKKSVRAVNHGDLFRSDKGGAAIASGEDGFDEEMGGQTQAAYEIYENVKDGLANDDDSEGNDDYIVDNERNENGSSQVKENEEFKYHRDSSVAQIKSITGKESIGGLLVHLENSLKANSPGVIESRSDTKCDCGVTLVSSDVVKSNDIMVLSNSGCALANSSKVNSKCNPVANSPSVSNGNHQSEKHHGSQIIFANQPSSTNTTRNVTQTKNKVLLMGHVDIDNAETTFSMADIWRPNYGKKNKKKKKTKST